MLLLSSTSALLQLVTAGTQTVDVHASYIDVTGSGSSAVVTPNDLNTLVSSASTTTVVASPAASTQRNIKNLVIRNTDATNADTVTVQHNDGTNTSVLVKLSLLAQYSLIYEDRVGWYVLDANGARVSEAYVASATAPLALAAGALTIAAATIATAGTMSATDKQKERLFIDPMADYGAKFDHKLSFDGAASTGSPNIITSATIGFVAADVGKRIVLSGAGASGAQYVGSITSLNSGTSVNVTPAISTTVTTKGLQVHTDDLTAWTNLISDINASTYPAAVIMMETPAGATPFGASGFTGRSGISGFLPAITKQVRISGLGGCFNSNSGNYWQQGGSCIAYVGTSNAPTAFGAVMTLAPTAGASNPNLKNAVLEHFWIDCRNGDQNQALKGLSLQSCFAWQLNDFFVNDPLAVGIEALVISPGTSGALGEAKDCSRGSARQVCVRALDATSSPGALSTTPTTTTTAIALSTTGQSLTLAAAITNQQTSGYVWVQTNLGYPVLVNFTGGGGTTTLTGCTISLQDTINAPSTVSGSNVVAAQPSNGCGVVHDGDLTANANLNHWDTCQVIHGTTWGPAAMEFRNSDSNEMTNCVMNGGSATALAQPNRITKPGIRICGSNSNAGMASRNNVFKSGSAGVGGISHMGILNTAANLSAQAGPTYWDEYQLANGEAIPVVEGNSYLSWFPNGGMGIDIAPAPVAVGTAGQAISAATLTLITGSVLAVPPQGFQLGLSIKWRVVLAKTSAAGTAARTFFIRIGTTGTTADAVVATITSAAGTGVADNGIFEFDLTIVGPLGATCAALAEMWMTHNLAATGLCTLPSEVLVSGSGVVMATFNSTTAQQFISLSVTTGAAETLTIWKCSATVEKPANP